ncbi:cytochrome c, partial [Stenotrophomonas maltophilia]
MKMILAVALALGGMSTSTAAGAKDDPAAGAKLYAQHCTACHGAD